MVTTTADAGPGSLRQAIADDTDGSPIVFSPSLAGSTIQLAGPEDRLRPDPRRLGRPGLVIRSNGAGAHDGSSRDLLVAAGARVTIEALTLSGGFADRGGAIDNLGTLAFQGVTVSGNSAYDSGGGIANDGTLVLVDSTVSGNSLTYDGVAGAFAGGGIVNAGVLKVEGSTIAGNSASVTSTSGGTSTTSGTGGGLAATGRSASLHDTILARNAAAPGGGQDLSVGTSALVSSLGHNLIGVAAGNFTATPSDLLNVDPKLGPLQDNGGPIQTLALLPGSPAIDAGDTGPAMPSAFPGLVGWRRGEGNANDTAGGDNGTLQNNVTFAPGQVGQAFQLDGVSAGVSFPDIPRSTSPSFTVGGWFNLSAAPSIGSELFLASKYDGNYHGWILRIGSARPPAVTVHRSAGAIANVVAPAPIALNTWNYIAATYDGNTVSLYVNGSLAGTATLAGGYAPSRSSGSSSAGRAGTPAATRRAWPTSSPSSTAPLAPPRSAGSPPTSRPPTVAAWPVWSTAPAISVPTAAPGHPRRFRRGLPVQRGPAADPRRRPLLRSRRARR